eukprot:692250-Prorocentrum_lima.AAC.1
MLACVLVAREMVKKKNKVQRQKKRLLQAASSKKIACASSHSMRYSPADASITARALRLLFKAKCEHVPHLYLLR